ncbi:MAG: threonylcarbamoyl-AMP synthase [Spartobacteria bacterium]|nr:threonylcarbamoyl-AMP synthase [Spartobacteria bacterium]
MRIVPESDPDARSAVCDVLRSGCLVVFPTETVYGVAVDARIPEAMERLYHAKGRDRDKPVAFFVHKMQQMEAMGCALQHDARILAKTFWPGALTLVVPNNEGLFCGFRMPDYAFVLDVLRAYPHLLAVTSANLSDEPPALTVDEAVAALGDAVALYVDGGKVSGTIPSTVVKVGDGSCRVLRQGGITAGELAACVSLDGAQ